MEKGGEGWGGGGRRKGKRKGVKEEGEGVKGEWNEERGWVGGGRRDAINPPFLVVHSHSE